MKKILVTTFVIFILSFIIYSETEYVCPQGHPVILEGAKFCTICGAKLVIKTKSETEIVKSENPASKSIDTSKNKNEDKKINEQKSMKESPKIQEIQGATVIESKSNQTANVNLIDTTQQKDTTTNAEKSEIKTETNYVANSDLSDTSVSDKEKIKLVAKNQSDIAYNYFMNKEFDKAVETYLAILKNTEDNFLLNYNLGVCYFYLNNNDESLKYLKKSLQQNNSNPETYLYLGLVNTKLNKIEEAKSYFRKILLLDVNENYLNAAYKYLKKLEGN